ncbi:MAG TPA: flagellar basal body rod protein FlgB [Verrucomicrobiae bacterium]|jgi:flagellar basal-body rod protein FlgB|nr:flagellar basal body rod protein FlgB [Verrucomicrobiae bacterium]
MIEALFNEPAYLAAKKTLDAVAVRQEAIASNIANLETPGYKRVDLAPSFRAELDHACASGDPQQLAALKPTLATDTTAVANSQDGNTVSLENEMMQLNQNVMTHTLETQMVSSLLFRLKMAITGKSS